MRVAFVKQSLDIFGPWSSVKWADVTPSRLLDLWPGKAVFWEMTCLLRADWFVVPQRLTNGYIRDAVTRHRGRKALILANTSNIVRDSEISIDDYDVIISLDPVFRRRQQGGPIVAYYVQEHWDPLYQRSLRRPIRGFDLFLAHMMDAPTDIASLPAAVSFPYLRDPLTLRAVFQPSDREGAWIDWRTLTTLAQTTLLNEAALAAAERLADWLGLPVQFDREFNRTSYGVSDPPSFGNARSYLEALTRSQFFVSVGRGSGAGQSLCDAASCGCVCIGESDKAYHRLLCHPESLCDDLTELPLRLRRVADSRDLQEEVVAWQDDRLRSIFAEVPCTRLAHAAELLGQNTNRPAADRC